MISNIPMFQQNVNFEQMQLMSNYWWWDLLTPQLQWYSKDDLDNVIKIDTISTWVDDQEKASSSQKSEKVAPRKRKNNLPKVDKKLKRILLKISQDKMPTLAPTEKSVKGLSRNSSGRRSKFIGVSKNNQNWQVLIKYIGTFPTQKEAAVMYDFYSIALHGDRANTNFNYDPQLVREMVESYFNSAEEDTQEKSGGKGRYFDPSLFAERVQVATNS